MLDLGAEPLLYCHDDVKMRLSALPRRPWELGGWLLGYWSDDCVVVTHATPPGRRGTPFGVRIDAKRHRPRFDAAWDASGGRVTFLGDWHTHPGGPASPSRRDMKALTFLAREPDFGTPQPLAAIVDLPWWPRSPRRPDLRFWLRRANLEVVELQPRFYDDLPRAAAAVPWWSWPAVRVDAVSR